jgi:ribonuclease T2
MRAEDLDSRWLAVRVRACLSAAILLCCVFSAADARHHRASGVASEPGDFDYYLLTLSWSPTYCLVHPNDRSECARKGYGFVLHGLWPQFNAGGYPENCVPDAPLSQQAEAVGRTVYPSPKLLRHEWQRHGTCSGLEAADYFRTADRALAVVRIPSNLTAPPALLATSPSQIASQFRAMNPGIPENGLTVACSRGELSEVRVCLSRELTFRACGRGVRNSCPSAPIEVPSSR